MQFVLAIFAILGGAAFWWWRVKMIGEAASEVHDAAGRLVGQYKRARFRRKVEDSPLEAVRDPVQAGVVFLLALAREAGPLTEAGEQAVRNEVTAHMGVADPTELMVFGKWVAGHVEDAGNLILRYAKLWTAVLTEAERQGFAESAERVADAVRLPDNLRRQHIGKLRERLGLER